MLLAERHESERLRQIIKELQRYRFGRKAETLPEEQMLLGLEDVQQVAACTEAGQDETAPEGRAERARKRRNNRGALPAHLPRIEVVVDAAVGPQAHGLLEDAAAVGPLLEEEGHPAVLHAGGRGAAPASSAWS